MHVILCCVYHLDVFRFMHSMWTVSSFRSFWALTPLSLRLCVCVCFICVYCHRQMRDEERCQKKYGEYWTLYTSLVPNVFFPSSNFFVWLLGGKHPFRDGRYELVSMKKRSIASR